MDQNSESPKFDQNTPKFAMYGPNSHQNSKSIYTKNKNITKKVYSRSDFSPKSVYTKNIYIQKIKCIIQNFEKVYCKKSVLCINTDLFCIIQNTWPKKCICTSKFPTISISISISNPWKWKWSAGNGNVGGVV